MNLAKVLEHLRWELEHLDRAIRSLECLHQSNTQFRSESDPAPAPESPRPRKRADKIKTVAIRKASNKTE